MTSTNFHSPCTSFPLDLHEEDHHHLFYLKRQASSSSSSSSLSNSILSSSNQEQGGPCYYGESQQIQHQGDIFVSHDGSSDHPSMQKTENTNSDAKLSINWKNGDGNGNPISSKMMLMKKMMNSDQMVVADHSTYSETQMHRSTSSQLDDYKELNNPYKNSNNTTIRVCSDCNTTKTPLWRSGPRGPKSLCNACGIRQRKARRAMAAAANGAAETPPTTTKTNMKSDHKVKHKNKRSSDESYNTLPIKKRYKLASQPSRGRKKICFEDLPIILSKNSTAYQQVFPQDEKEAAILLMALSYGLVRG